MQASRLITELENVAVDAKMAVDGLSFVRAPWSYIPNHLAERFGRLLLEHPGINQIEGKVYSLPSGSGVISLERDAIYLIQRVLDGVQPQAIIQSLINLSHDKAINTSTVRAIEGVGISLAAMLSEDLSIVPAEWLPSYHPEVFSHSNSPAHGFGAAPSAAVVLRQTIGDQFLTAEIGTTSVRVPDQPFQDAFSALLLASDGAPQYRQQYTMVNDLGWPGLASAGFGEAQTFPERVVSVQEVDWTQASITFNQLAKVAANTRRPLQRAISKLETSRRRATFTEKAVELGMCIEMLLMHGGNDKGEITNKVATRAAWLLGKDSGSRLSIFRCTRDLYNDRSKVAHGGEIATGAPPNEVQGLASKFASYDLLCRNIIKEIARRGSWPDWTALVLDAET